MCVYRRDLTFLPVRICSSGRGFRPSLRCAKLPAKQNPRGVTKKAGTSVALLMDISVEAPDVTS